MIVTLAGRRTDPQNALPARFPLEQSASVRAAIEQLLKDHQATALVSSAACGADLLALEVAGRLGIRRRVVLCFAPERFRATSVIDRPGEWGPLYDRVIAEVQAAGDLVLLAEEHEDVATFLRTNQAILDEAQKLAREARGEDGELLAVLIWEGKARGEEDVTAHFRAEARARAIPTAEILTLKA